jgi:hypothetical protein
MLSTEWESYELTYTDLTIALNEECEMVKGVLSGVALTLALALIGAYALVQSGTGTSCRPRYSRLGSKSRIGR